MTKQSLKIAVVARDQRPAIRDAWKQVESFLLSQTDVELVAAAITEDFQTTPDVDLALVIGGDGAILRACRQFGETQIPILGINLGRLGFLADLTVQQLKDEWEEIAKKKYDVVSHLMFHATIIPKKGKPVVHLGLNELAVSAGASLMMFDVGLAINGQSVTTYSGDGVIISTPVGSTAHSLSAGGPLLKQDIHAFVVTPICPHTLTIRPIVDRADCLYELTLPDAPEGVTAVIDGQIRVPLHSGDRIELRKANVECQLVRLNSHNYYQTLHRKLGWDGQPSYRSKNRQ